MSFDHRLFFALLPPLIEAGQMSTLGRSLGEGSPLESNRVHITLWVSFVFSTFPHELAGRMQAVAAAVTAEGFLVRLTRLRRRGGYVALRPGRTPVGARQLAHHLSDEMRLLGDESPRKKFNLHATLLYDGEESVGEYTQGIDPIQWYAREFVLIHSIIGQHRHVELGRWALESQKQGVFPFDPAFFQGTVNLWTARCR